MRFIMQSSAKSVGITPSAALSVAAHVLLIGAAVQGTGERAKHLQEKLASAVVYLPPPDRRVSSAPREEHVEYLELGAGTQLSAVGDPTELPAGKASDRAPHAGDDLGASRLNEAARPAGPSTDSVYSILTVEESATRTQNSASPVYPPDLLAAGVEGGVVARYVVDTSGRADPASIQILRESNPAFTRAVREAIPAMRFTPGMVQGRPVRQVVEQGFEFRVAPPVAATAEHTRTQSRP